MVRGLLFHFLFRVGPEAQWQIPFGARVIHIRFPGWAPNRPRVAIGEEGLQAHASNRVDARQHASGADAFGPFPRARERG